MKFNIFFGYKRKEIIYNNISLEIEENKVTTICGHNGAGKTTLLKLISGFLPSSMKNTEGWYVSPDGGLIQHFTLKEHLNVLQKRNQTEDDVLVKKAIELFEVQSFENKRISSLSTGQTMIASIIVAIASSERLILLDEPFGSLDPVNAEKLAGYLKEISGAGRTVVITSHDLFLTTEVSDNIFIIKNGKVAWNSKIEKQDAKLTVDELRELYHKYA